MIRQFVLMFALLFAGAASAAPIVTSVTAQQRYPWNGLVDIVVTIQGESNDVALADCLFAATNSATKAAIPVGHITRIGIDMGSGDIWKRKFIWDAAADVGAVKIDDVTLVVDVGILGVQLWEGGPLWSECNVGASKPEEYGYYFWWGDTVGYKRVGDRWNAVDGSVAGFSFSSTNCPTHGKSDSQLLSEGYIDETGNLVALHDAATAHLGTPWRMPSKTEFDELLRNCQTTWTTRNGVSGRLVIGRGAFSSNSIFLPAVGSVVDLNFNDPGLVGFGWLSTRYSQYAYASCFHSTYFNTGHYWRFEGRTVRPVRDFVNNITWADGGWLANLSLDCSGAKVADRDRLIVYDASWYTGGVKAKITANGHEIESGTAGVCTWTPSTDGVNLLTLNVYNDSEEVVGTEQALCLSREDLTELVIPDGATEIGEYAFAGGRFTSVTIPSSVTSIAPTAFVGCTKLKTITLKCKGVDLSGVPEGCEIVHDIDYRVVFDLGGHGVRMGGGELEQMVHHGSAVVAPEIVPEGGYEFVRWDSDFSCVTSDMTVKAVWFLPLKVTSMTAQQRYPWNGLVDVIVTIQGMAGAVAATECAFAATNSATKEAIAVEHITRNGEDSGSGNVWTRKFIWDAGADVGAVKINDIAFTVNVKPICVQLWENGPYWAECNVGATKPEECGYYFWWGDTVGYKREGNNWNAVDGSRTGFSFSRGNCPTYRKSNSELQEAGYIDATGNLVAACDAATAHLGAPWRMPTDAEFAALTSRCDSEWTSRNGVSGRLVKGKGAYASKSIFLPAAGGDHYGDGLSYLGSSGEYWSSTPFSYYSTHCAWHLGFSSSQFYRNYTDPYHGQSVRPVRGFANNNTLTDGGLSIHLSLDCRGAKVADGNHPIVYDVAWYTGGVMAKIMANGQEIVSGNVGTYAWMPSPDGVHYLTLNVHNALGEVVGSDSVFCLGREDLKDLVIPEGVTEIGANAFAGGQFTSVTIPSSVKNIGVDAFASCANLQRINVESFLDWQLVEFGNEYADPLHLGAHLCFDDFRVARTTQGFDVAGYDDLDEVSVMVPHGVIGLGERVFADMENLEQIELPETLRYIGKEAFANDYWLDNVVIPDSVESIGDGAFSNCTEMTSIEFGEGLKSVGAFAFCNCISLEAIEFKEGLETLGDGAFSTELGSMRLKSVSLPASLTTIGDGVFDGCDHITGVTVPTHLKTMAQLFPDAYWKVESVVIPEGETVILDDMFKGCKALKTVLIPNTVTNIGESAFEGCEALEELGLPDEVSMLGARAFYGCVELRTVTLPRNLSAIENETFGNCPWLDSLVVPASVSRMGSRIYSGGRAYDLELHSGWYSWNWNYETRKGIYGKWYYGDLSSLTGIYFLGDAPDVQPNTYEGMSSEAKSYVVKGSKGWYIAGSPTLPPDGWPTCGNARAITYWTPNRFDVTFDGNGGTPETYASEQITDTTYSLPKTNPTRMGYLFDGWWTEPKAGAQIYWNTRVTATKAHTLYAHWKSLKDGITVIFNPNGGTVSPDEVEYPAGVTYGELPVPTRIGHEFLGWYTSQVGGDLVTEATEVHKENNELYAHWRPITYWIVFDANGGYGSMERQLHTYNESKSLSANEYYLNGFKFTGWAETRGGAVKYGDQKVVENLAEIQGQEVTLYAVWNGANYAVRFNGNGGSGSMENQTFVVGVLQELAECQYTRTGYAFAGWATTPSGTVTYKDKEDVKNLTMVSGQTVNLYAVWTPIQYLISYHANGGGGAMSATVAIYDEEVVLPGSEFSRAGHRFVGWAMEPDGEAVYEAGQRVQNLASQSGGNVIMYAVWELEQVAAPTVSPADGTVFEDSCHVTLACSTVGAAIYYRVGAQPKATDRFKYTQPFEISETSVIYAFAKLGELQSETICVTLNKGEVLTFAKAVNAVGVETFELGGDDVWKVIETDGAKFDAACVQSGEIGDNQISWFKTTVQGAGTIRFWWKASCEEDELKDFDHLVFMIDGYEIGRLDGVTDWVEMLVPVQTTGPHILMWAYVKDDGFAEGDDCGWVDGISWEPLAVVDPIPEIDPKADAKAVQAALAGSTDARLAENITDAAAYNAYREWALKIDAADVKASPFAWASFATDSAALLAKMPTDNDLKVEEFKPSATAGAFDFTVSVKDVTIGDKASEDNLKKLFGLGGAESLDPAAFSSEKVALDFKEPEDGKLKFTATPADDNARSFFMKVKVKQVFQSAATY